METKNVTSTETDITACYKWPSVVAGTLSRSSEETTGLLNDSAISLAQHYSIYMLYLLYACKCNMLLEYFVHVILKQHLSSVCNCIFKNRNKS